MVRKNNYSKDPLEELIERPSKKKNSYNIVALIIVFFAAVSLTGTAFYIYNQSQDKPEGEVVVILADENTNEMKVKPSDPGGMVVDNMDKVVYDTIDGSLLSKEEEVKILSPVEEPIDKNSEIESFPTEEDDEEPLIMDEEIVNPVAVVDPVIEVKEEIIVEVNKAEELKPKNNPAIKKEQYIEPKKKESSKKISKAIKTNINFYKIQLASFKSKSDAEKEWSKLSKKLPKHIGGHEKYIVAKDVEGKGIFYRLQIGPFDTKEEATKTCNLIKQSGVNCFIVKPSKI